MLSKTKIITDFGGTHVICLGHELPGRAHTSSDLQLVWIQRFPSFSPISIPTLKGQIFPTISFITRMIVGFIFSKLY